MVAPPLSDGLRVVHAVHTHLPADAHRLRLNRLNVVLAAPSDGGCARLCAQVCARGEAATRAAAPSMIGRRLQPSVRASASFRASVECSCCRGDGLREGRRCEGSKRLGMIGGRSCAAGRTRGLKAAPRGEPAVARGMEGELEAEAEM